MPQRLRISSRKLPCEGSLLQANQSDLGLVDELREVEMRLREIEDEAVFLRFEREMIECELKARIGNSPGIDGVATWESKIRRNFCLPLFQEHEWAPNQVRCGPPTRPC